MICKNCRHYIHDEIEKEETCSLGPVRKGPKPDYGKREGKNIIDANSNEVRAGNYVDTPKDKNGNVVPGIYPIYRPDFCVPDEILVNPPDENLLTCALGHHDTDNNDWIFLRDKRESQLAVGMKMILRCSKCNFFVRKDDGTAAKDYEDLLKEHEAVSEMLPGAREKR